MMVPERYDFIMAGKYGSIQEVWWPDQEAKIHIFKCKNEAETGSVEALTISKLATSNIISLARMSHLNLPKWHYQLGLKHSNV